MQTLVSELEQRVANRELKSERKEFPDNRNYYEIFLETSKYINSNYAQFANLGAAVAGDGLLTDHGPNHIKQVSENAGELISDINSITGYEIFLLLMSILFHDIGNVYGRANHEKQILDIMKDNSTIIKVQNTDKRFICDIATAHGGSNENYGKDTIRAVIDDYYGTISVQAKALAAVLRFADEISDDNNRAYQGKGEIPDKNLIFHEYSRCLQPIAIEGETIRLIYEIPYQYTQNKIEKNGEQVFLYDEILNRLKKCMIELEYCKKYDKGLIKVSSLSVTIRVLKENDFRPLKEVTQSFRLSLQGYPVENDRDIKHYLQDNEEAGSSWLYETGEILKEKVNSNVKSR